MTLTLKMIKGDNVDIIDMDISYDMEQPLSVLENMIYERYPDVYPGSLTFHIKDVVYVESDPTQLIQYIDRLENLSSPTGEEYRQFVIYLMHSQYDPNYSDNIAASIMFIHNQKTNQFALMLPAYMDRYHESIIETDKIDKWYPTLRECMQAGAPFTHFYLNDSILEGAQELFEEEAWTNDQSFYDGI